MHKRTARASVLAVAAVALTFAVAGCGSDSEGDEAACKEAITEQFKEYQAGDENAGDERPEACEGIDDKTAERLGQEIAEEELKGVEESLDAP
ncbi:hypothetical protein O7599_36780 [Streptomyces sp. WMMC500]|uniref:hypothetical protein n=1 Tax=Streptomyces sp. WMMC500 TaxID=3015154 RepID=UPI00248ACB7E|nr:hypothetical protein [Streptomyces sp. WMMC500]WBB60978.1 hypothetical protein O7599_36780 [Streptomyces sp. WMMC500]